MRAGKIPSNNIMRALPGAVVPTRDELAAYWHRVADEALPYLARRPLTLVRHIGGLTFFHKQQLPPVPPAVHQLLITKRDGEPGVRVWIDSEAGLLGLLDMDVVEVHPWGATVDDIEHPDCALFDLDPGDGVEWASVTETALDLRDFLQNEGLRPWVKTSGGKGLHVMAPLDRRRAWPAVRVWTKALASKFAAGNRRCTIVSTADRSGRIFIDYLRNGRGNTAVGAFSPRARQGFPVSYPVTWADVARGIRPDAWTMSRITQTKAKRRAAKRQSRPAAVRQRAR